MENEEQPFGGQGMTREERKACHQRWSRKNEPSYPSNLPSSDPVRQQYEEGKQCGACVFFVALSGPLGMDWGVCGHPKGDWDGQAVFEHFSCEYYEHRPEEGRS